MMPISAKSILSRVSIALVVLFVGFALSSGIALNISKNISDKVMAGVMGRFNHHILTLRATDAKHYFLLPVGGYSKELYTKPLSFEALGSILANSIFNVLFQPVFFSPFTPQVILNVVIFPFFLYGAVRYFRKTWPMLMIFIVISFQIGIYDSVVEALIRHGMPCELIYLLIGMVGFTGWITKNS